MTLTKQLECGCREVRNKYKYLNQEQFDAEFDYAEKLQFPLELERKVRRYLRLLPEPDLQGTKCVPIWG